jgi:hypothetical protein
MVAYPRPPIKVASTGQSVSARIKFGAGFRWKG